MFFSVQRSALLFALAGAVALALLLLAPSLPAAAQCGGSSSTCTSCHEIKARFPVNTVGVWHTDHALSDSCAACHQGDKAASDPDAAHAALADPLADPAVTCAACHQDNAGALAAVYVDLLAQQAASAGPAAALQPASADPLDAPLASADPLDAPLNASAPAPAETAAAPADTSGNKALVVTAEALMIFGIGTVFVIERKRQGGN